MESSTDIEYFDERYFIVYRSKYCRLSEFWSSTLIKHYRCNVRQFFAVKFSSKIHIMWTEEWKHTNEFLLFAHTQFAPSLSYFKFCHPAVRDISKRYFNVTIARGFLFCLPMCVCSQKKNIPRFSTNFTFSIIFVFFLHSLLSLVRKNILLTPLKQGYI